jgi:hypothetical protein
MKIEVLYVPGCPNYQPAIERIEKVLESESLRADIERIPVKSDAEAKALEFPGSPTIRINGNDVQPNGTNAPGLACRLYPDRSGVPSEHLLRMAMSEAKSRASSET